MGISPLMLAAMNGHTAAVKLLLDMGSDVNAQVTTHLSHKLICSQVNISLAFLHRVVIALQPVTFCL